MKQFCDLLVGKWGAQIKGYHFPCSVGRSGIGKKTQEGDGITPEGTWDLVFLSAAKMPTKVEEGCAARTTLKCCYALLQTVPGKLLLEGFVRSMVRMDSARLAIARLPQRAKGGVQGTAAAERKSAK